MCSHTILSPFSSTVSFWNDLGYGCHFCLNPLRNAFICGLGNAWLWTTRRKPQEKCSPGASPLWGRDREPISSMTGKPGRCYRMGTELSIYWTLLPSYLFQITSLYFYISHLENEGLTGLPDERYLCFLFTWWFAPSHLGHAFTYAFWEQLRPVLYTSGSWKPIFKRLRSQ